jgi:Bacterial SH3 domain
MAGSNHSEQMVGRSSATVRHDSETTLARADEQRAPLPPTGESTEPSFAPVPEDEKEEAIWVLVVRWATVHSGPSVSAPTVRFYPVGTELQVVDYQRGWFQVLEAATSQRGWIYEKYYLQPIPGPGQMIAAVSDWSERTPAALEAPKPRPHVKRVKKSESQKRKKIPPRIARARIQRESVANIMDRALRR